jgi:hypothetical protein
MILIYFIVKKIFLETLRKSKSKRFSFLFSKIIALPEDPAFSTGGRPIFKFK